MAGAITPPFGGQLAANLAISPTAVAGGTYALQVTPAAHTAVIAEVIDNNFKAYTFTITGSFATNRSTLFDQPTITAGSALTVTTAATVAIAGAPIAAGSAVITNAYAFWVQTGNARFDSQVQIRTAVAAGGADLYANTTLVGQWSILNPGVSNSVLFGTVANNNLNLMSHNIVALTVDTSQLTGIGTAATSPTAVLTVRGSAVAAGIGTLLITPAAHTTVVAEVIDNSFAAHTMTITGSYATQRHTLFAQPTITAGSALTVTTAATVAISGAPIAAGSAVITTPLALWVQTGTSRFDGTMQVASVTYGLTGINPSIALVHDKTTGISGYNTNNGVIIFYVGGIPRVWYGGTGGMLYGSGYVMGWTATGDLSAGVPSAGLVSLAAANIQIGLAASATPVANTLTVGESSRAGTDSNIAGASGTIRPGKGTGTGTPAPLILSAPVTVASGTTTQTYSEGIRVQGVSTAIGIGFYGVAAVARQLLATGGGATVDQVITALQTLGLVRQS